MPLQYITKYIWGPKIFSTADVTGGITTNWKFKDNLMWMPWDQVFIAGFDENMVQADIEVSAYGDVLSPRTGEFMGELGYIDTAPTGSVCIVDVEKNGTSIYSTKPQFAIGANELTAGTLLTTTDPKIFDPYDRITFKVTQVGSGTAGKGLRFALKCRV